MKSGRVPARSISSWAAVGRRWSRRRGGEASRVRGPSRPAAGAGPGARPRVRSTGADATRARGEPLQDAAGSPGGREAVVGLVGVAHQAVVAGRLAVLAAPAGPAADPPRVGVEVADPQGLPGHPGERVRVVEQPPQHAGAALGRLVEQELPASSRVGKRLGGQLVVFELERTWIARLERRLERGHRLRRRESPRTAASRALRRSSTYGTTRAVRGVIGSGSSSSSPACSLRAQ